MPLEYRIDTVSYWHGSAASGNPVPMPHAFLRKVVVLAAAVSALAADEGLEQLLAEANAHWEAKRYSEAASSWQRALLLDWPAPEDAQRALARANLGMAQLWLNQVPEARENIEAALHTLETTGGGGQTENVAKARSALCAADVHLSWLNPGLQHCRQALEALQVLKGEESIEQADILSLMARLRRDHGNSAEGETLCRKAVRIYEQRGAGQSRLASAWGLLAQLLLDQRRPPQAAPLLAQAREALEGTVESERQPALIEVLGQTARLHLLQGAANDAVEPLDRAIRMATAMYGNTHRMVIDLRALQVLVLERTGRRKEAGRVRAFVAEAVRGDPMLQQRGWTVDLSGLGKR
jgi:tetratricopeptide (TPR) repeat protein